MGDDITRFLGAIEEVYTGEITERDRERAVRVEAGGTSTVSSHQIIPTAKVTAAEHGRHEALEFIYKNWSHVGGPLFDAKVPLVLIEMYEIMELRDTKQFHTGVIRACSFFESFFAETLDVSSNATLGSLIDAAAAREVISQDERKLYHFVREVRNECGHNTWLDLDHSVELLSFSDMVAVHLIQELADYIFTALEDQIAEKIGNRESNYDADDVVEMIEAKFQWTCTVESGDVTWEWPESWNHPDREYTSYEDYWAALGKDGR
jgi:hypothetical protein